MEIAGHFCGGIGNGRWVLRLGRSKNGPAAAEERLKRLADDLDRLADKDDELVRRGQEIDLLRRSAAAQLHAVCVDFVADLNKLLKRTEVRFDPDVFAEEAYEPESTSLFQIQVRGRILQITFTATPGLASTEEFRIPYILEGSIRAFSQEMLDKELIEEQLLFYTLEGRRNLWRYFCTRTYRSGPFDREYLTAIMEKLL